MTKGRGRGYGAFRTGTGTAAVEMVTSFRVSYTADQLYGGGGGGRATIGVSKQTEWLPVDPQPLANATTAGGQALGRVFHPTVDYSDPERQEEAMFETPVYARAVRIHPLTFERHICMRAGVLCRTAAAAAAAATDNDHSDEFSAAATAAAGTSTGSRGGMGQSVKPGLAQARGGGFVDDDDDDDDDEEEEERRLEPEPKAATTTAAEEEEVGMKYRVASKDGARMRAEADKASTPLHIIKSGTTVEVLDVCHVRSTPPAWLLVTEIGHKIVQGSSLSPCKTLHLVSRLTSVCAASGAAASRWHEAPACGRVQAWLLEAPGGLDFSQQARPEQSKWPAHRLGRADRT